MRPRPFLTIMKTASELMMDILVKKLGRAKAEKLVADARRELKKEEAAWKKRKRSPVPGDPKARPSGR